MYSWFECKITYDRTGDDGLIKTVKETYLVDAQSFTEAEARITLEMKPFISGDFTVANIRRIKVGEMFDSQDANADRWYRSKVNFISLDEDKGVEKRIASTMFIKAADMEGALRNLLEGMKTTLADYEIASISETSILDVYEYAPIDEADVRDDD
ncbi:MAG: DUF4494 domain-containing protein [Prevotellaceae bacterium]|jgi:hypothetical protein|nr:DUF4494 domain-containing protein [Prevotellaceae bacterium]